MRLRKSGVELKKSLVDIYSSFLEHKADVALLDLVGCIRWSLDMIIPFVESCTCIRNPTQLAIEHTAYILHDLEHLFSFIRVIDQV